MALTSPQNQVCLSIRLSVCLSVSLSVCLSVCLSGWLAVCLAVGLAVSLSAGLSVVFDGASLPSKSGTERERHSSRAENKSKGMQALRADNR